MRIKNPTKKTKVPAKQQISFEKFEKSNKNVPEITNQITSYLGGRRKTKKRYLKNKQKKTKRSRK